MPCEFSDLKRLRDRIGRMEKENQAFVSACAKELAARLLAKVIKRTPVGQYPEDSGMVGGTLRRGWTSESDKQAMYTALFGSGTDGSGGTGSQKDVYGKGAVAENVASFMNNLQVTKQGNKYTVTIINPVEYAMYVEYGHRTRNHKSWVPGKFMLTISEKEIQRMAPAILEKKLNKYLQEAFHAK